MPVNYLESLAAELRVQADRVRHLIGDAHWYLDGRHKEQLLTEVIRRHLPLTTSVANGFVVTPTHALCSREQDVLVLKSTTEAPVFSQGGLSIAFPRTVLAAVSVKTQFTSETLRSAATGLMTVRAIATAAGVDPRSIWCGAYFFESPKVADEELPINWLKECTRLSAGVDVPSVPIDVFACASRYVFLTDVESPESNRRVTVRGFRCEKQLSTAIFISHLIDHVAVRLGEVRADFVDFADVKGVRAFCTKSLAI
jgi:lambda repressor-like predicted transcriptional regulator